MAHYPATPARVWYLAVTLATAVTLYSHIFVAVSVVPLLQRELGFTLQHFGLAFIGGSLAVGFCSDRLQVRKPFMLIGTVAVALTLLFFMGLTPDTGLGVLILTLICLSFCLAMGNVSWLAAFTETAETINPALIGTALAILGAILRLGTVGTAASQVFVVGNGQNWAIWWWVCIACLVVYLPSMLVLAGGWSPARARAALVS